MPPLEPFEEPFELELALDEAEAEEAEDADDAEEALLVEVLPPQLDPPLALEAEEEAEAEEALLVDVLDETLPLDEEVVDTLPLEVEVDTPLDVDTLPLEVETPLDVDTLPLEVETPPVDVETPPVEVETLPLDVEVEMPPVEVLVEAVKMTLPLLDPPPKKPPLKKPPPKPPPKPPLPPTTTAGVPPPPVSTIRPPTGMGGGSGTIAIGAGCVIVRVRTVVAGAAQAVRRTVRRTTRRLWLLAEARRTLLWAVARASLTTAGREGGFSATWTAPPPMIAPPHAHAHNCAKAIRTDIEHLFLARSLVGSSKSRSPRCWSAYAQQMQRIGLSSSALTILLRVTRSNRAWADVYVPERDSFACGMNEKRDRFGGGAASSATRREEHGTAESRRCPRPGQSGKNVTPDGEKRRAFRAHLE